MRQAWGRQGAERAANQREGREVGQGIERSSRIVYWLLGGVKERKESVIFGKGSEENDVGRPIGKRDDTKKTENR